jgi:hypothetical protein
MALLTKGDVLVVIRLDRQARSTRDLLNLLGTIGEKEAGFKSLRDNWADTTTAHGRLMLTVLGGLAEFERELIRTRTGEGRERAKARGVILGRKPKLTGNQRREAIARRELPSFPEDIAVVRDRVRKIFGMVGVPKALRRSIRYRAPHCPGRWRSMKMGKRRGPNCQRSSPRLNMLSLRKSGRIPPIRKPAKNACSKTVRFAGAGESGIGYTEII